MMRRWRGVLAQEGVQTGDGRVIAEGALTWADLPLPLGWLQQEQHGDGGAGAVQVGTIDTITRTGNDVIGEGTLDDEQPDGAEVVRRMEAGTAPMGNRFGVSIDPDDWEFEVVATGDPEAEEDGGVLIVASGSGPLTEARTILAAAGDPDPGTDGTVVYAEAADEYLERYTRLRIRGATAVAGPAFDGAYLELADEAPAEETAPPEEEPVAASAAPVRPDSAWFAMPEPGLGDDLLVEQPGGGLAVPLTIGDDGRVFGHLAPWDLCHTGMPGCVTAPRTAVSYAHFHVGEIACEDGTRLPTGVLTAGTDHAARHLRAPAATDHYAHTGLGWADVRMVDGEYGPWFCGALRPDVSDEQVRVLRASGVSGDWRTIGGTLELIGALAVNYPGFPIARSLAASAGLELVADSPPPSIHWQDGRPATLVAGAAVFRCAECQRRAFNAVDPSGVFADAEALAAGGEMLREAVQLLRRLDHRTQHLNGPARDALAASIRG